MIFFGSKGKTVSGKVVEGIQCPSCESQQFFTFGIIRYFHLYWIPTILLSKKAGIECTHCKRTLFDKEIPQDLSKQIKATLFNKKNTLPMFSGLIIIACLALFCVYIGQQNSAQESAYIEHPATNDLYIVNLTKIFPAADSGHKYGLLRIKEIFSDRVEFQIGKLTYNKASGINKDIGAGKAQSDSYYDNESVSFDIGKLKGMKESGAIYSIERK